MTRTTELRQINPTSRAPYRLRFLTLDFPAAGALVVEWHYRFSKDDYVAKVKRVDSDRFERFVQLDAECSIRARDFTDHVAAIAASTIVEEL